jgi:hypothetical protein
MTALWIIVWLLCMLCLVGSLIALLFRRFRPRAKWAAPAGAIGAVASFVLIGVSSSAQERQVRPPASAQAAPQRGAQAEVAKTESPVYVSKSDALKSLRVGGLSWDRSSFGTVLVATFVVYNDNRFPVKDVEVTCAHAANSGTVVDSNVRTVYEKISPRDFHSVVRLNMGFMRSVSSSTSCRITDFTRV